MPSQLESTLPALNFIVALSPPASFVVIHRARLMAMEASQALQRRFMLSLTRSLQCQCSLSPAPQSLKRQAPQATARKRFPSSSRALSTTRRWHQEAHPSSQTQQSPASSKPTENPKEALKSYISSIQTIIDGYKLKDSMAPRQHEQLVVALTNAEVRLEAPGQTPESFNPFLHSLQGEINPILQRQFGTTDIKSIRTKATSQPTTPSSPRQTMADLLDPIFRTPQPRYSALHKEVPRGPSTITPQIPASEAFPDSMVDKLQSSYSALHSLLPPRSPTQRPERLSDIEKRNRLSLNAALEASDEAFMNANPSSTRQSLRLKPTLGRTIGVNYSSELTRAFRQLEGMCARNKVKSDQREQRFHVRRGQKRKDMRISRWRKQFMDGFLAECARVRRMRRQGW